MEGIATTASKISVCDDAYTTTLEVYNILDESVTIKHKNDANIECPYTVPAKTKISLPKTIALDLAYEIAKNSLYNQCENKAKWKGFQSNDWVKLADTLLAYSGETPEAMEVKEEVVEVEIPAVAQDPSVSNDDDVQDKVDYDSMSYRELQAAVKATGVKNVTLKKVELIKILKQQ